MRLPIETGDDVDRSVRVNQPQRNWWLGIKVIAVDGDVVASVRRQTQINDLGNNVADYRFLRWFRLLAESREQAAQILLQPCPDEINAAGELNAAGLQCPL